MLQCAPILLPHKHNIFRVTHWHLSVTAVRIHVKSICSDMVHTVHIRVMATFDNGSVTEVVLMC